MECECYRLIVRSSSWSATHKFDLQALIKFKFKVQVQVQSSSSKFKVQVQKFIATPIGDTTYTSHRYRDELKVDKNWAEVKQCNREEKSSGVSVHI